MKEVNQIINDIKNGQVKPIYFLAGEETFFIDKISDYFANNLLPENAKSFDQMTMYGLDVDMQNLLLQARRFPMIADKQLIIIKEAQHLFKKKAEVLAMENYLEDPVPTTVLVFDYKYKKMDKRKKLYKLIQKKGVYFEHKKLYERDVAKWVSETVKSMGYSIDIKSTQMLIDFLGTNLSKIDNELKKLSLLLPKSAQITPDVIETNIGISKDYNNFELKSAIAQGDYVKAQRIVNYFTANPKEHSVIFTTAILYMFFKDLFVYHSLNDKSQYSAAKALGINPYFVAEFEKAAKIYPMKRVSQNIGFLKDADLKTKGVASGSMTHKDVLNELLYKLMH